MLPDPNRIAHRGFLMDEPILLMQGITKVYPNGFMANSNVNLSCRKGEIHALLGENGAGKTTLMKMLFGFEEPTEGSIRIKGKEVKFKGALDAIRHGVGMVHQHFMLVDMLTVAENVVLGDEPVKAGLYDKAGAIKKTRDLADKYQFNIDPTAIVKEVTVATKQKIEILKALLRGAEILVLDEPTAVLTPQETRELFVQLNVLREAGHTIIFISHKLNEVKELCDSFTVLRKGRVIGNGLVRDYTPQMLSNMMVGRDVLLEIDKDMAAPRETVASVKNLTYFDLSGLSILDGVSFSVQKGMILGIAGVEGNGQNELSEILTGLRKFNVGEIEINRKNIRGMDVRKLRDNGVASISEDRMSYGCAPMATIAENLMSDRFYKPQFSRKVSLKRKDIEKMAEQYIKEFNIACTGPKSKVGELSGGNIQKVIVAREFTSGASFIVANQPTRGIDVGATEFIRRKLIELTRTGNVGALLISADLNEVMEVSDSLLVMHKGKVCAYFENAKDVTEDELGEYMLGLKSMTPEEVGSALK